jgi:hypothetical protein
VVNTQFEHIVSKFIWWKLGREACSRLPSRLDEKVHARLH